MRRLLLLLAALLSGNLLAQVRLHGHVVDRDGRAISGAQIQLEARSGTEHTVTDNAGYWSLDLPQIAQQTATLRARAASMQDQTASIRLADAADDLQLMLLPATLLQQETVTATRSRFLIGPTGVTETSLTATQLREFPALTLDESLRQHAGFELFRRSSGWVQNPTSQGVSLRGLGSTAASRTLVLADSAPLNDPFGGWVHWNELPAPAIEAVTISSGGGSDLYGSSALGGVVDLIPTQPGEPLGMLSLAAASEDTRTASGRADLQQNRWHELAATEILRTAGYVLVAPASRGRVDVPANVHFENGRGEIDRTFGESGRAFVTGNVLNEARGNGTPLTTNGTRLWRYLLGDDWSAGTRTSGRVRLFGSDEAYRQSFSAVPLGRNTESLSRVQHVGTQELGASSDASFHLTHGALVAGADLRDIRATDVEKPTASTTQNTSARQRFGGGFAEAIAEKGGWSGAASLRLDSAMNLDTRVLAGTTPKQTPNRSEVVVSPRIGLVRQLPREVVLHASAFRAFRTPTMNELYRTGQVGQEITQANAALVSERATGVEGGIGLGPPRVRLQASYFWTEINRPVAAVVLSTTATTILEMRQNLGQIQSQGAEATASLNEGHALSADVGYQFAHAEVTRFSAQAGLVGKWIPAVPRQTATAQLHLRGSRAGEFTLAARNSGRAYDDSANLYVLHSFFQLDAYGERTIGRGFTAFVSVQNLLGRRADVARTPVLTQGIPLVAQGGVRYGWGVR